MKEIVSGVFTWSHHSPEKRIDFNGWYVASPAGPVVVDPPPCGEDVLSEIEERGLPHAVILTNKDHGRDAEAFAGRFRAPILIHQADAALVNVRIGGVFGHLDKLPGDLTAIHVPDAKSPGECALLLPHANAIILGDALIGRPAGQLNLLPAEKFADAAKAREGIATLLDYVFDAVLVGDGASFPKGGRRAMEEFLSRTSA